MFRSISRISTASCGPAARGRGFGNRRNLSLISVHSTFPATLYRFQLQRESRLYDKNLWQDGGEVEDAVEVSKDGLVCPGITNTGAQLSFFPSSIITQIGKVSNGALFMPNTHFMQELTRMSYDHYMDSVQDGQPSVEPSYICIPKG
jgi:hypothetical protein